jgi:hypothetical protein
MQTLTVTSCTLFSLACDYLGDATQWNRIASLNGINDPWISGIVTISMPPVDLSAGGGIASQ